MKSSEYNFDVPIKGTYRLQEIVVDNSYLLNKKMLKKYGLEGVGWWIAIRLMLIENKTTTEYINHRVKYAKRLYIDDENVFIDYFDMLLKENLITELEGIFFHKYDYRRWCSQNIERMRNTMQTAYGAKRGGLEIMIEELNKRREVVELIIAKEM